MAQRKRDIRITVRMPKEQEMEAFQNRVNEIYCELVGRHLKSLEMGTERKIKVLDELLRKWK